MELDVGALALLGDEHESIDSETLDVSVRARNTSVGQMPGNHMGGFGHK